MESGKFYHLKEAYFLAFQDKYLMTNKETFDGKLSDRHYFFSIKDETMGLFWLIPFSSQIRKHKKYYNFKMQKYNHCDTICFWKSFRIRKGVFNPKYVSCS